MDKYDIYNKEFELNLKYQDIIIEGEIGVIKYEIEGLLFLGILVPMGCFKNG